MSTDNLLDGFSGLSGIVERNSGEVVVTDVGFDDVVEEELADEPELSVNGGTCTTGKGPFRVFVMGQGGVGVLQEGQEDDPVVDQ